ncbi:MAG: hypothetical protein ALECFALPRED_001307 [Alectoria fallacina]|uniref:Protein kinase domain-containing protein n=1 Tax=Alectoria fallacina TaxID=1903189 RepID=A0A8H3IIB1_9LECA|nr:MAG: hypothetical protein ALECFALPRED_001307 [Alectoria fallacina]
MPLFDLGSLLVLVEPDGDVARAVFQFPENAKRRRFGLGRDGLTNDNDHTLNEMGLKSRMIDGDTSVPVHIALSFDPSPKDVSKGFVFGSDPETCDVLLAKDKTSGISGNLFSINIDWRSGNPLITCLTPNDGSTCIRIRAGKLWYLYLQHAWEVLDPGVTTTIKISEDMKLVVHNPGRKNREPAYSSNLQSYFKKCQVAVPSMTNLKLYDPEPTPLLVSRGRGLTGMEYFTTSTIVGERVVLCEAKSYQKWTGDSKTFIIKRFRNVNDRWPKQAKTELRKLCVLRHVRLFYKIYLLSTSYFGANFAQQHIIPLQDIITDGPDGTDYIPVYLPEPLETLADRHIREPLTEIEAGDVLAQVFEGLKFLHTNGIVHGGLYPGNIKIKHSHPWPVKLSDIGLHPYVELDNSKERKLYASQSKQGRSRLVPVIDTWSAGVVGLSLLRSGGLPPRSTHWAYKQHSWTTFLVERATAFHANEKPRPNGKKDAALFLTRVLKFEYSERLTAEECLQDPWIQLRRLPYDREDSQNTDDSFYSFQTGSIYEDAKEDQGSNEDIDTEEPRTCTSKGKQPQTSRDRSAVPSSSQHRQGSATPQNRRYSGALPQASRYTSVEPSDSVSRQGSIAPSGFRKS